MWQDIRHAVRVLRKHRAFVVMATLVLALGIGLNTAIFSIAYAMLWKPLPVSSPNELVYIYQVFQRQPDRPIALPLNYFEAFSKHSETFSGITAHWGVSYSLRADDETDRVNAEWVYANYFEVLAVQPTLGRTLGAREDDRSNPELAVVISHALWKYRFRSDPNIAGKRIALAIFGDPYVSWTVVGVMDRSFMTCRHLGHRLRCGCHSRRGVPMSGASPSHQSVD